MVVGEENLTACGGWRGRLVRFSVSCINLYLQLFIKLDSTTTDLDSNDRHPNAILSSSDRLILHNPSNIIQDVSSTCDLQMLECQLRKPINHFQVAANMVRSETRLRSINFNSLSMKQRKNHGCNQKREQTNGLDLQVR